MSKFAIYIHVPWCRRRCPYCDFYFVVGKPHNNFTDVIIEEWNQRKHDYFDTPSSSLYFGGGTPSLLNTNSISRIIDFFYQEKALDADAEITIEANPEDITLAFAHDLACTRVNRISLGVQSFSDHLLRALGRKHTAAMAKNAISMLRQAGFNNISVDLIIGGIDETPDNITNALTYLNDVEIPHISAYLLTIEERTKFYKLINLGLMQAPNENYQVDIYDKVQDTLRGFGFIQYDISSYARPGFFSRHNQIYWANGNYIGLGPKAHSMRLLPDGGIERLQNQAELKDWLDHPTKQGFLLDQLSSHEALKESLAFGLRNMAHGIRPEVLARRHQAKIPLGFFEVIKTLKNSGWLEESSDTLKISRKGALFADRIMRDILAS